MRPTQLGVKPPVQKTPCAGHPVLDKHGKNVILSRSSSGHTFSRVSRFPDYSAAEKKLGFRLGPGTYNSSQTPRGVPRVKQTQVYRQSTYPNSFNPSGFYYSGNLLVYEPTFVPKVTNSAYSSQATAERSLSHSPRKGEKSPAN